ncbi:MAG: hypothetical protein WCA08_24605 [Desulfoferrobacter sp.]
MKRKVAFTLRFDPDLYERVKKASRRNGRSVTAFVQDAVAGKLKEEEAASLYQAFSIVGEDAVEADVEFAREAQREVVSEDD